jgi:hypothetical protein
MGGLDGVSLSFPIDSLVVVNFRGGPFRSTFAARVHRETSVKLLSSPGAMSAIGVVYDSGPVKQLMVEQTFGRDSHESAGTICRRETVGPNCRTSTFHSLTKALDQFQDLASFLSQHFASHAMDGG